MMKKRIIPGRIFFLLLLFSVYFAGTGKLHAGPEKNQRLQYDTSSVEVREPAKDKQSEYSEGEAWRYDRDKTAKKSQPSVFDRMWDSFWENVIDSFRPDDHSRSWNPWTILWVVLLITIIVLVILKVTDSGISSVFSGKSKKQENIDATLEDVDIHLIDYEKEIRLAIANGDYRLAVRLWFLRTLKTCSDKGLVSWKIDKTNSDYYYELSGTNYQKEFGEVSKVYDYIWYGEFPVDSNSFSAAEEKFRSFNGRIEA